MLDFWRKNRTIINSDGVDMRTKIKKISSGDVGKSFTVKGWVRTIRDQGNFSFIEVNDGSTLRCLQVIADSDIKKGEIVESPGKGQSFELKAKNIEIIGLCDSETYPLQKKRHTFEFLRTIAHLRPRTNTIGAVTRVRSALAFATHKFFQENGFYYIQTPIITESDCEGAGEMFKVTTLDLEKIEKKEGKVDFERDFFGKKAFLTVSGQLEAENFACALSDVYTFGPTFRAENSNTSRHLAEFWMIEPEMAFADINDDMDCAERYMTYILKYILDNCEEDIEFFNKFIEKGLIEKLTHVVDSPFERLSYTDAIEILKNSKKKFEFPVEWGRDLQSEHVIQKL
jgi:asparaginyl-tRNA synthetase